MRALRCLSAAALLASLTACAPQGDPWSDLPISSAPELGHPDPQPPGSLPPGAAVNAPLVTPDSDLLRMNIQ